MNKVCFITGGTGFIARSLIPLLHSKGWTLKATVRTDADLNRLPACVQGIVTGELESVHDWESILRGANAVVHLAARVHRMEEDTASTDSAFEQANVAVTERLSHAAAAVDVKRFIYASSVKAVGEYTSPGLAWNETDPCRPSSGYGRSKRLAEERLLQNMEQTGLETVILRFPMVYGPGVKANMFRLLGAIRRGIPLPLGSIENKRSVLYVENCTDAIFACLEPPAAKGEIFFVSDGQDISTTELIDKISRTMTRRSPTFPFPPALLRLMCAALGKRAEAERLLSSLIVDTRKIRRTLGWVPPYSIDEGLRRTVNSQFSNVFRG